MYLYSNLSCIFLFVLIWHHYNFSSARYCFLQLCGVFVIDIELMFGVMAALKLPDLDANGTVSYRTTTALYHCEIRQHDHAHPSLGHVPF